MISTPFCEHPMIPLRGKFNDTHWRIHVAYAENVLGECLGKAYVEDKWSQRLIVKSLVATPSTSQHHITHADRIGARHLNITNPYKKSLLDQLRLNNRGISLKRAGFQGKEDYCCSFSLLQAMRSQTVSIEQVYSFTKLEGRV